jgi:hypothetical protein
MQEAIAANWTVEQSHTELDARAAGRRTYVSRPLVLVNEAYIFLVGSRNLCFDSQL